jgi:hypothetical protein
MDATVPEENYLRTPTVLGHRLVGLLRAVTVPAVPAVVAALPIMVILVRQRRRELLTRAGRRAGGRGDRRGQGHADSHIIGASRGVYDTRRRIEEIRHKKSSTAGDNDGFPAFSTPLRNLLHFREIQASGDH